MSTWNLSSQRIWDIINSSALSNLQVAAAKTPSNNDLVPFASAINKVTEKLKEHLETAELVQCKSLLQNDPETFTQMENLDRGARLALGASTDAFLKTLGLLRTLAISVESYSAKDVYKSKENMRKLLIDYCQLKDDKIQSYAMFGISNIDELITKQEGVVATQIGKLASDMKGLINNVKEIYEKFSPMVGAAQAFEVDPSKLTELILKKDDPNFKEKAAKRESDVNIMVAVHDDLRQHGIVAGRCLHMAKQEKPLVNPEGELLAAKNALFEVDRDPINSASLGKVICYTLAADIIVRPNVNVSGQIANFYTFINGTLMMPKNKLEHCISSKLDKMAKVASYSHKGQRFQKIPLMAL